MKEYTPALRRLEIKYSSEKYGTYKDGGLYSNLLIYRFNKEELSIVLYPSGKPEEHIELIESVIKELIEILPLDFTYKLSIGGFYSYIKNGSLDITLTDGNYYIKDEHQLMHDKKEIATILEVAHLNNISYTNFKWSLIKKKSIELGFTPVKEKRGQENLYLIEAFKICYPEYNYNFFSDNVVSNHLNDEPKRKKFWGLF